MRYVGKTVHPRQRLNLHLSRARNAYQPKVYAWIRGLLKLGLEPKLLILAAVPEEPAEIWQAFERTFIATLPDLTNMGEGGEGVDPKLISKAHAKTYVVTHPDGREETITNLSQFCREHGLYDSLAGKVVAGKRTHTRGYKFRRPGEPPREVPPKFVAIYPDGRRETYHSHAKWARANGYSIQNVRSVASGQKRHYRGIRIERLGSGS